MRLGFFACALLLEKKFAAKTFPLFREKFCTVIVLVKMTRHTEILASKVINSSIIQCYFTRGFLQENSSKKAKLKER